MIIKVPKNSRNRKDDPLSRSNDSKHAFHENKSIKNGNPLFKFCELILNWNILDEYQNEQFLNDNGNASKGLNGTIPIIFHSQHQYIDIWEPLVMEEIKANTISNFIPIIHQDKMNDLITKRIFCKKFQFSISDDSLNQPDGLLCTLVTDFSKFDDLNR